jgi:hypothetical protein
MRVHHSATRRRAGTATVEFALALPIALGLGLVMVQSALLMVGNLCVHYAAFCAARSAIVQVPLDRSPDEGPNVVADDPGSAKRRRMADAAAWAALPVSTSHPDAPDGDAFALVGGLDEFFARYGRPTPAWAGRRLGRRMRYAQDHTRVTMLPPAGGVAYGPAEDLSVFIEHTFHLSVPYASRLFELLSGGDGVELAFGRGQYGTQIRARCTLTNEGVQDYVDIEPFPRRHP